MKTVKSIFFAFFFLWTYFGFGQQIMRGIVMDAHSGERLIEASIWDLDAKTGTTTDKEGHFSLKVNSSVLLKVSYMGYQSKQISFTLLSDTVVEVFLELRSEPLGEVVVQDQSLRISFDRANLSVDEIIRIPNLTGKPDVLKAVQLLPGIRAQGEMSSVTLVRGGNPGENLYLIDNTPLIYVHHIGGYMSVFNPDMIRNVEVFKGSFPAKYGERLSSIFNLSLKEGNAADWEGSLSIGLSDLSFSVEGPTKLKNSSIILTGRKTLVDIYYMCATGLMNKQSDAFLSYGFHDISGKFSWNPTPKHSFHLNVFQGDDYLGIRSKWGRKNQPRVRNIWGNWLAAADWSFLASSQLFVKSTLSFSSYRLKNTTFVRWKDQSELLPQTNVSMRSSLQDYSLRSDANYFVDNDLTLNFGLKASGLRFVPAQWRNSQKQQKDSIDRVDALESAVYFSGDYTGIEKLKLDFGLRIVNYSHREICHFSLEPRLSLNYAFVDQHVLNINYMRVSQNAQLIFNTGNLSASEIYVPSGKEIPVSFSHQLSVGWHGRFQQGMFFLEGNVYYKTLDRLTTYKPGYAYSVGDLHWREKLVTGGRGISSGMELTLKKPSGRWTGFVAYTLSKSTRVFSQINDGKNYDDSFDSPHALALNVGYAFSEKWSFSLSWQFQSGLPFTPVIGRYLSVDVDPETGVYTPYEVLVYGARNSDRMRSYHRLDFAFTYTKYSKRQRKVEWVFGLFNAYNRQNPYMYFYSSANGESAGLWPSYDPRQEDFSPTVLFQTSFFQIMPMISYKIFFGERHKRKV